MSSRAQGGWQVRAEARLSAVLERAAERLLPPPRPGVSPSAETALLTLRQVRAENRFFTHLVGWAAISLFLVAVNLAAEPGEPAAFAIAGIWGAGVVFHGFWTLRRRRRKTRARHRSLVEAHRRSLAEEPAAGPPAARRLREKLLRTAEEVRDALRPVSPETLAEVSRGETRALALVSWLGDAERLLSHHREERELRRETARRLAEAGSDRAALRRLLEQLDRSDRKLATLEQRAADRRGRLESLLLALENARITQAECCDITAVIVPLRERVARVEEAAAPEPAARLPPGAAAGGPPATPDGTVAAGELREEVRLAQELQRSILPAAAPAVTGLEVAHVYRPSKAVGGDFYDFYVTGAGRLLVAVGDASGHGLDSSMVSSMAKSALYMQVKNHPGGEADRLAAAMAEINRMMCDTLGRRRLMTLTLLELDAERRSISWVNAGQIYPLLRRDGEVEELEQPSYPLGVRRRMSYPVRRTDLEPGDLVLLLTDGYLEAQDGAGDPFGWERLVDRLGRSAADPSALLEGLAADLEDHLGDGTAQDDVTLVAIGYRGS